MPNSDGSAADATSAKSRPQQPLMKDRHKFLVLDGPSQVGKTTFCKQLTRHPDEEYVEIDCSSLQTAPNFHVFTDSTSVICWDELD